MTFAALLVTQKCEKKKSIFKILRGRPMVAPHLGDTNTHANPTYKYGRQMSPVSLSKKSPKEVAFLLKIWYNRSRKIQVVKRC